MKTIEAINIFSKGKDNTEKEDGIYRVKLPFIASIIGGYNFITSINGASMLEETIKRDLEEEYHIINVSR